MATNRSTTKQAPTGRHHQEESTMATTVTTTITTHGCTHPCVCGAGCVRGTALHALHLCVTCRPNLRQLLVESSEPCTSPVECQGGRWCPACKASEEAIRTYGAGLTADRRLRAISSLLDHMADAMSTVDHPGNWAEAGSLGGALDQLAEAASTLLGMPAAELRQAALDIVQDSEEL